MKSIAAILLSTLTIMSACNNPEHVDLLVRHAHIYTVDDSFGTAEAMAVKDGKIVALGADDDMNTRFIADSVYDADGAFIYPGLIDAHCHFLAYGLTLDEVELRGTKTFDEVVQRIVDYAANHPGDAWILGRGWDQNDWPVSEYPVRDKLDSLFPGRPVYVRRIDGHAALANGAALERAGIDACTDVEGGKMLCRDDRPTGILIDNAMDLVSKYVPAPDEDQLCRALLLAQERCLSQGLTTVCDAGLNNRELAAVEKMAGTGALKIGDYIMLSDDINKLDSFLAAGPYFKGNAHIAAVKAYADGALGSRGAALLFPYADDSSAANGLLIHPKAYFEQLAEKVYHSGFQLNTHCIGDSANRMMLHIYHKALQGDTTRRWRIEHAQVVDAEDRHFFGEDRIIPSVQPTHATSDMYWAHDRLGGRIQYAYAYKSLYDAAGVIAFGTDFPVEKINPLATFYAAVARKDASGYPEGGWQMEQAMDRKTALRAMTIMAAYANFEEDRKGSLEPGKEADFVCMDKDLLHCDTEEILMTKICSTWISGERLYDGSE